MTFKRKTPNTFVKDNSMTGYFDKLNNNVKQLEKEDVQRLILTFVVLHVLFLYSIFTIIIVIRISLF